MDVVDIYNIYHIYDIQTPLENNGNARNLGFPSVYWGTLFAKSHKLEHIVMERMGTIRFIAI